MKADPTKKLVDFNIVNDRVIALEVKSEDSFEEDCAFQSDIISVLTTCYGRLKLYSAMEKVGEFFTMFFFSIFIYFLKFLI